jgi:hypothetical protein
MVPRLENVVQNTNDSLGANHRGQGLKQQNPLWARILERFTVSVGQREGEIQQNSLSNVEDFIKV